MQTFFDIATFLVLLFVGIELLKFARAELKESAIQYKKLDTVFTPGNQVLSTVSGDAYIVVSRLDGAAYIRSVKDNNVHLVDWLTPARTLRHGVAEQWTLATAP